MVDFEDFVKDELQHNRTVNDEIKTNVTELCVRVSVIETKLNDFIDKKNEEAKIMAEQTDKKYKKFGIIMAFISGLGVIWNVIHGMK